MKDMKLKALHYKYIETNHIRHFIKISFSKNKVWIYLPSIFSDNTVVSSITSYFENTESPIVCHKYNTPICYTILKFNKLISHLFIETSSLDS